MKKIITVLCLLWMAGTVNAQTILHASTSHKQICYWNPSTSLFDNRGENIEYPSMFTLNGDETMFTHTTNDIKSTYYVSKKNFISSCSCYEYDVTSDVGNKYTFIVDVENDMVKIMAMGHSNEKDDYLIIFTIKRHWKD